jgi:hypothetical protein
VIRRFDRRCVDIDIVVSAGLLSTSMDMDGGNDEKDKVEQMLRAKILADMKARTIKRNVCLVN